VDVNLVLETLSWEQTRPGEWVNVIGYVTENPGQPNANSPPGTNRTTACVQAILLWSAGPVNPQQYEESVKALAETDQVSHSGG
jgi:hypothetical protein